MQYEPTLQAPAHAGVLIPTPVPIVPGAHTTDVALVDPAPHQ